MAVASPRNPAQGPGAARRGRLEAQRPAPAKRRATAALGILLVNPNLERILQPYVENLASIGIDARLRTVDRAQYKQRLDQFDFDMILMTLNQTLSPGLEQWQYFHSSQAAVKGSKNYAGIANPVVDHLLEQLLAAQTRDEQVAAGRALDRVLLWQHYSIPNWYLNYHRLAYRNRLAFVTTPPYTLGLSAWWLKLRRKPNDACALLLQASACCSPGWPCRPATCADPVQRAAEIPGRLQALRLRQPGCAQGRHLPPVRLRRLRQPQPVHQQGRAGRQHRQIYDTLPPEPG
jgi:microcin C transport system substrate-binding protein